MIEQLNHSIIQSFNYSIKNIMEYKKLTPEEEKVILYKGTETPFSGKYVNSKATGIYCCKRCHAGLYFSGDKFESHCGWPSFDDAIPNAVKRIQDTDGRRIEILCMRCGAHLGHVFEGEGFTDKDTRYCVNSISMDFVPEKDIETAYFASGCFWGVEYHFSKAKGVLFTSVGFMGGDWESPSYEEVYTDKTGHAEVVKVVYDKTLTNYENLVKLFFETHDFSQLNRQGPDIGTRYRSALFIKTEEQEEVARKYLKILSEKGYQVATRMEKETDFWTAENYHQHYYDKKGDMPYCHIYKKIFA